jgi:hypothetical protein
MANIKKYFRNTLIALATIILASVSVNNPQPNKDSVNDESDDFHMFI